MSKCKQCGWPIYDCTCAAAAAEQPDHDPFEEEGPDGCERLELDFDVGGEG